MPKENARITAIYFMNSKQILDNLSNHLKNVLARAIGLATSFKQLEVRPLHLLLSVLQEKGSLGAEILIKLKFDEKTLLSLIEKEKKLPKTAAERGATTTATLAELSDASKKALEKAMLLAYEYEQNHVGTEHLLYGLIHTHDRELGALFKSMNLEEETLENEVLHILESANKFPAVEEISSLMEELSEQNENASLVISPPPAAPETNEQSEEKPKKAKPTVLDLFTLDLTASREQKNIDPVIGREEEIERLIHILSRRTKNNPVLVGEPGVGKTAIVEGLAKRIVEGKVPDILKRKKILSLDLTLLISGTIYRGEFEGRLRQIVEELSKHPDVILFIDEIHNIIGAGSNQGTLDAANILKPALARGKLRCIGATTLDEYKKYISSDPALERRFQSIQVEEPNRNDAIRILQGVAPLYEEYHEVKIPKELLESIVDLSMKFVHDNFLPDKAIDILDEASAAVKVSTPTHPLKSEYITLEKKLSDAREKKQDCILNEEFEKAKKWKKVEEKTLSEISKLEKKLGNIKPAKRKEVTLQDIASVLGKKLHTNKDIFLEDDYTKLERLKEKLKTQIIGQEKVIDQVIETLERSSLGLKNKNQPFASFLFVGPTGVGKTELAKLLARELYQDEKALIKMDMSEFSEQHGISKLLGSPAGYIGYKERNHFSESLKKRPYSVVLFDEVDKAHADVVKLLLQILDEGELTESNGKKIIFRHAIVILTSNVGAELFKHSGIGFGNTQEAGLTSDKELSIQSALKENFGAPLLSRLDGICLFSPLKQESLQMIIQNRIANLCEGLKNDYRFSITPDEKAIARIMQNIGQDMGARSIHTTLEKILFPLLFEQKKNSPTKKKLKLTYDKNAFVLI